MILENYGVYEKEGIDVEKLVQENYEEKNLLDKKIWENDFLI